MAAARRPVRVGDEILTLSNLDKVFYPKTGFTKGQVIDYYARIAPALLPHLRGRPLVLKRYPDGVGGDFFYQRECPAEHPAGIHATDVAGARHCVVDDLAGLVWLANLADLELHTFLCRDDDPQRPDLVAFDLDPGAPADVLACADVALRLRRMLQGLGLESWVKTSGGKGLQVYVPLHTPATFEQTRTFARAAAVVLERDAPELVVSVMRKSERTGRVYVDWAQNMDHKSTVCVYSLRARDEPTVSTPLSWDELEAAAGAGDAARLRFTAPEVLARAGARGDLWEGLLTTRQVLPGTG